MINMNAYRRISWIFLLCLLWLILMATYRRTGTWALQALLAFVRFTSTPRTSGTKWLGAIKDSKIVAAAFPDVQGIDLISPAFISPSTLPAGWSNGTEGPTDLSELGMACKKGQLLRLELIFDQTSSFETLPLVTHGYLTSLLSFGQKKAEQSRTCSYRAYRVRQMGVPGSRYICRLQSTATSRHQIKAYLHS